MVHKRQITPRQAAARRENGKKGRGPTGEDGKAVSRLNAIKTGVYSNLDTHIASGPLAEDKNEYNEFQRLLIDELYYRELERHRLDESPLLLEAAHDVFIALRNKRRWRSWAALSYEDTAPPSPLPPPSAYTEMSNMRDLAAAETLRNVAYASKGDLDNALGAIGNHTIVEGDRTWARLGDSATRDKIQATLLLLLENHDIGLEEAAEALEVRVASRAEQLERERRAEAVQGVRELLRGDSLRRLIAAESHTSRELDRAWRHYVAVLERLKGGMTENEPTD